jgi:hypothetical protein
VRNSAAAFGRISELDSGFREASKIFRFDFFLTRQHKNLQTISGEQNEQKEPIQFTIQDKY